MIVRKVTYISDAINSYVSSKPRKKYQYISPSSLGGCMRSHFFKLRGIKQTTPPELAAQANFEVGHIWEQFMARAIKESTTEITLGKWYRDGADQPFYIPELNLGGTPDLLIGVNGELVVGDSKTMRSEFFQYRKNKSMADWVKDQMDYIIQIGCYILLLQSTGLNVNKGVLAFASKNDGYVGMEMEIEMDDELEQIIRQRCNTLNRYLETNQLPPCECEGWKRGWCGYGNPNTRERNKKGKLLNTECCMEELWLSTSVL